jgi:hypothetical protein
MFYNGGVSHAGSAGSSSQAEGACPRCLELEDEATTLRERLRQAGLLIAASPGPNPVADGETELRRRLPPHPRASAANGLHAGWARLAWAVRPRPLEDDVRCWRLIRESEQLRARLDALLGELERARDRPGGQS